MIDMLPPPPTTTRPEGDCERELTAEEMAAIRADIKARNAPSQDAQTTIDRQNKEIDAVVKKNGRKVRQIKYHGGELELTEKEFTTTDELTKFLVIAATRLRMKTS